MLVVPTTTKAADPTGSTFPTPTLKPLADGFQRVPVKKSNPIKVTIPNIQCQPQCVHQSGVSESFEAIPWASKSESPFVALYGENECLVLVPQGNNIAPVYQKGQCPPTELKQRRGDLDAYWSLIEKTDGTFNILSAMGWSNATNGCLVKGELGSPLGNGPCVNAIAVTTSEATTTTDDPPNPASTTPAPPSTCTAATCTTTPIPVDGGGTNVGAIAGGVVAGIAVVAVAAGFAIRTSWKKRQQKPQTSFDLKELSESADKFPGYPSDATLAPIRTASAPSNFTASGPVDAGAYYSSASTVAPVAGGPAFQRYEQ